MRCQGTPGRWKHSALFIQGAGSAVRTRERFTKAGFVFTALQRRPSCFHGGSLRPELGRSRQPPRCSAKGPRHTPTSGGVTHLPRQPAVVSLCREFRAAGSRQTAVCLLECKRVSLLQRGSEGSPNRPPEALGLRPGMFSVDHVSLAEPVSEVSG